MEKFLLGVCLILCGFGAQAQNVTSSSLYFGPKLGANMANIWNEMEDNTGSVFGANVGVMANIRFTKKHAIQTELAYSGKGFEKADINTRNTFHYAEIPFLYQRSFFSCKKGGHLAERRRTGNVFFVLGPQLSVLLKSTLKFTGSEAASETTDMYVTTRPFDMSAVAGIGYNMKNGLVIDARYALGLRHLHAASETIYMPKDVTNTAFQVSLGYLLPVKLNQL